MYDSQCQYMLKIEGFYEDLGEKTMLVAHKIKQETDFKSTVILATNGVATFGNPILWYKTFYFSQTNYSITTQYATWRP